MGRSLLLSLLVVVVCAVSATGGFLAGRAGGPDLRAARRHGVLAGAQAGARAGRWFGHHNGYRAGYRAGYAHAYKLAYRQAVSR